MKENAKFFTEQIWCEFSWIFRASIKLANIIAAFKVGSTKQKDTYIPISILPIIAKIFEKLISQQLSSHFDNNFSKFECGLWNGYGTKNCLLLMIEKSKKAVDNKMVFGALLSDLSKTFDSISHDHSIAKLHTYGLLFLAMK